MQEGGSNEVLNLGSRPAREFVAPSLVKQQHVAPLSPLVPTQVKSALSAPGKIIELGPKQVFVYKDIKFVFMNGKVSDME